MTDYVSIEERYRSVLNVHDEETPAAYLIVGKEHRWLSWSPEVADADKDLVTVLPLFLHRRQPISETPSSVEAVTTESDSP